MRIKRISMILTAFVLALLIAATLPVQVFADAQPEYIDEVKIGMGKTTADAEAALAGYTILTDAKGNKVDLNNNAGGGLGSKGDKVVYLGYKTTNKRSDAITDLALMNMQGGYSVPAYDALMEKQMKSQIVPFVDNFLAAIKEYRINYNSEFEANRTRARYIHDLLNKLTDDDCGGKKLGDLLLNETKYEMGDDAYNKLSDEEKKNHADILTIIAQANGNATLIIERLITKAADTAEDSWLDRFSSITYDDLVSTLDMLPSDADAALARLYDDDAQKVLAMWEVFREQLLNADEAKTALAQADAQVIEQQTEDTAEVMQKLNFTTTKEEDYEAVADATARTETEAEVFANQLADVTVKACLEEIEYGDGTLYDFFTQSYEDVSADITVLYPLVAALSDGQRAGMEFISLSEFVMIGGTDAGEYKDEEIEALEPVSIYDGVNREIYQKGGVALTSDALRDDAAKLAAESEDPSFPLQWWTMLSIGTTLATAAGFAATMVKRASILRELNNINAAWAARLNEVKELETAWYNFGKEGVSMCRKGTMNIVDYQTVYRQYERNIEHLKKLYRPDNLRAKEQVERLTEKTATTTKLAIGLGIAAIILGGISTYLAYQDLVNYYKVDFTPIPRYMVEETDITAYDTQGNKIVIKNQTAYYKAVECNRSVGDEFYEMLDCYADMNGDVGKQWLALYAQKSDSYPPILANSLLVKVDNDEVPANFKTGIHMFGSSAAFNLNSELYDWNKDAPSVRVYFKVDESKAASTSGSNFTAGSLAISGVAGFAAGAIVSILASTAKKKREVKGN